MKNYYNILGIENNASDEQIKKAYRKLSTKLHPDKNESDTFFNELFKNVNEAYSILSDKNKRIIYDRKLQELNNPKVKIEYVNIHPEPLKKVNVNKRQSAKEYVDWGSVRKWEKTRNVFIILNVCLVILIFVPKNIFNNFLDAKNNKIGTVTAKSGLNLRRNYSKYSEVITIIPFGENVEILDKNGKSEFISNRLENWFEVSYNGKVGWIWGGYVELINE